MCRTVQVVLVPLPVPIRTPIARCRSCSTCTMLLNVRVFRRRPRLHRTPRCRTQTLLRPSASYWILNRMASICAILRTVVGKKPLASTALAVCASRIRWIMNHITLAVFAWSTSNVQRCSRLRATTRCTRRAGSAGRSNRSSVPSAGQVNKEILYAARTGPLYPLRHGRPTWDALGAVT